MIEDKKYCMSSFLMYRVIVDEEKCFSEKLPFRYEKFPKNRKKIYDSNELYEHLKSQIKTYTEGKKCAIALSGGIDSAILLNFMPENTIAYTFKCIVPGIEVVDESPAATRYIKHLNKEIEHKIVPVYWEDMVELSVPLMKRKGAPIHSIEVQIYKAAMQAKEDGCEIFIFGETADCIYGGHSQLLSQDWTFGDFVDRWSFVSPYKVLYEPEMMLEPYREYEVDGYIDVPAFLTYFESRASLNSYLNACDLAEIKLYAPYAHTIMGNFLDFERIRRGENKYLVREVFSRIYDGFEIPPKTPMPRPMNEWLKNWDGPTRKEFIPHCIDTMTGDQKWLIWILERYLDLLDEL